MKGEGKKIAIELFTLLPAGRYTFLDLLAKFNITYECMGGPTLQRPDEVVYKAAAILMKQGVFRKGEDFRGYERIS